MNQDPKLLTEHATPDTMPATFEQPTLEEASMPMVGDLLKGYGREGQVGKVTAIEDGRIKVSIVNAPEAAPTAIKTVEQASAINVPRSQELNGFDEARKVRPIGSLRRKIGAVAAGAAVLAGSVVPSTAAANTASKAPAAIEQVTPDAGFSPYKNQEAKDANTFGTAEHAEQLAFGNAQRSWEVEGKVSADKVGKPMEAETTDKAFESLITDARTNADVYAQLMVGCEDRLGCTDLDQLAAKYDAATADERQKMYGELEARMQGAELDFETWNNYGTTFLNTADKSVNWNNDRRTDGMKVLRVTLPGGEVFHVVTECEQLAFQPEQAEAKHLYDLPQQPADQVSTPAETPEQPGSPETPNTPDTPQTPETPDTPEEPETPTEEDDDKIPTEDINVNPDLPEQVQMGDDRVEAGEEKPATEPENETYDPEAAAEQEQQNAEDLNKVDESIQENPADYEPAPVVNDGRSTVDMTDPANIPGEQTDDNGNTYTVDENGNVTNQTNVQE